MPPGKHLTEKDIELLKALQKCVVLNSKQASRIYGNVKNYHYQRTNRLQERGYIIKHNGYIEITKKGAKAIGQNDVPARVKEPWQRKFKADIAEIYFALPEWRFLSSREIKRERGLNRSSRINAYIEKNNKGYAVYLLNKEPQKSTIKSIKNEFHDLDLVGISGAIIFCPTPKAMKIFGANTSKLREVLLLPYPYGLKLLGHMEEIDELVQETLQGFKPSKRAFADYEKGNTYASVLIYNDLAKKDHLTNYLKYARDKENKEVIIVCLENQSKEFAKQFPGIEQIIIPEPWIDFLPADKSGGFPRH